MIDYVFPGLLPYIEAASKARNVDERYVGQAKKSWHSRQVENAIANLSEIDANPFAGAEAKLGAIAHAVGVALSLIATAEACADAIVEASKAHGIKVPELADFSNAEARKKAAAKLAADFDAAKVEIEALKAELAKLKPEQTDAEHAKAHEDAKPSPPPLAPKAK